MRNNERDQPLVFSAKEEDAISEKYPVTQNVKFNKEKAESDRKTKTLEFCFTSAGWIAAIGILFLIFDALFQHWHLDTTMLKDGFSLISYIITAALGYMFANNKNN